MRPVTGTRPGCGGVPLLPGTYQCNRCGRIVSHHVSRRHPTTCRDCVEVLKEMAA